MPKEDKLKIEALKLLENISKKEKQKYKNLKNISTKATELKENIDNFIKIDQLLDE